MKSSTRHTYAGLLNRVTDHIYAHLDDKLDMDRLASVANMSPYHWHRIYHALSGETIAATVKRLRLHRAAGFLVQTDMSVAQVARRSGYPNLQSFTRIFHAAYGMPPAEYRKRGSHTTFLRPPCADDPGLNRVVIRRLGPVTLAAIAHTGSYMMIGKAFDSLFSHLGGAVAGTPMRTIGVFYDDPTLVPEHELRSVAGVVAPNLPAMPAPLTPMNLAGGSYAVLRHQGPYADMAPRYQWLYGIWLPQSGREPADLPLFEEYLNNPRDTAPAELLTDIYLPLRPLPEDMEKEHEKTEILDRETQLPQTT